MATMAERDGIFYIESSFGETGERIKMMHFEIVFGMTPDALKVVAL